MYPPSAPIYWNTRPRWQGDNEIRRKDLESIKKYPNAYKIERIHMNSSGEPEYIRVSWGVAANAYIVELLTPRCRSGFHGCKTILGVSEYIYQKCGIVSVS